MICQGEFDLNIIFFIILFYLRERRKVKGGKELATDYVWFFVLCSEVFLQVLLLINFN